MNRSSEQVSLQWLLISSCFQWCVCRYIGQLEAANAQYIQQINDLKEVSLRMFVCVLVSKCVCGCMGVGVSEWASVSVGVCVCVSKCVWGGGGGGLRLWDISVLFQHLHLKVSADLVTLRLKKTLASLRPFCSLPAYTPWGVIDQPTPRSATIDLVTLRLGEKNNNPLDGCSVQDLSVLSCSSVSTWRCLATSAERKATHQVKGSVSFLSRFVSEQGVSRCRESFGEVLEMKM